MDTPILVNASAGSVRSNLPLSFQNRVSDWLHEQDARSALHRVAPKRINKQIQTWIDEGRTRIAVGGGDGTLSRVSDMFADNNVELVPLPMGTLNHFARDLGVSLDPQDWSDLLVSETVRQVDLGDVQGRAFLNNFSIGFYPAMAKIRADIAEERILGSKRLATLWSSIKAKAVHKPFDISLDIVGTDSEQKESHTHSQCEALMVSNNAYGFHSEQLVGRASLEKGRLVAYLVRDVQAIKLAEVLQKLWDGEALEHNLSGIEVFPCQEITATVKRRKLSVAVDGELTGMPNVVRASIARRHLSVVTG